jgi:hypothetical protein
MAAPADAEAQRDTLRTRLEEARRQGARGTLTTHRRLWRYCSQAFRDWCGGQLIRDAPILEVQPLTNLEMAELLQLAREVPAVIRDLLKLQVESRISRRHMVLRKLAWSPERQQMLVELHRIALFAAGVELGKAKIAFERATADLNRGNYERSCEQRQRMVTCYETQIASLEDQLQSLTSRS